ncbi:hypothetical protein ACUR5C_00810 [Aliikangiella sp. IMCC44653]
MKRIFASSILLTSLFACQLIAAVLVKDKQWPKNSQLNVVFLDGDLRQKNLVKDYAPLWTENTSLSFKFFDSLATAPKQTHIRVSFLDYTGSIIGNHADLEGRSATLLLAELSTPDLPLNYAKRFILHEFGHALGLEHEYRNPNWPYGKAAIEEHLISCVPKLMAINYNQTAAQAKCREINSPLNKSDVVATVYDETSIMNYPQNIIIDATAKPPQKKQIKTIFKLSVLDKLSIQRWYSE